MLEVKRREDGDEEETVTKMVGLAQSLLANSHYLPSSKINYLHKLVST